MTVGLLTAGSGQSWENELVVELGRPGARLTVIQRCADVADVLAQASTGQVSLVVVSANLRRLDTEAVGRLHAAGVAVVAVYPSAETRAPVRLERIGITSCLPDDAGTPALMAAIRSALTDRPTALSTDPRSVAALTSADPRMALPGAAPPVLSGQSANPAPRGTVVAVWGRPARPGGPPLPAGWR